MIGFAIGDTIGSVYEFNNTKDYNFEMFTPMSEYTDDTVMSMAVAKWLLDDPDHTYQGLEDSILEMANKYRHPKGGYGGNFNLWLFSPMYVRPFGRSSEPPYVSKTGRKPYNSAGNGSAMRVAPVGWMFDTLEETERVAEISAAITHNDPEGIKGAQATAACIFMARNGATKEEIKDYIENKYGYNLAVPYDVIKPLYGWDETCKGTVPPAIICFLESRDFEDAVRLAVSLGGDSDTLCCITAAIADAFYPVPEYISEKVMSILPDDFKQIIARMEAYVKK